MQKVKIQIFPKVSEQISVVDWVMVVTCPRLAQTESYVFIPRLSRRPPYPAQFFMHPTFHALSCIPSQIVHAPQVRTFYAPNLSCSLAHTHTRPNFSCTQPSMLSLSLAQTQPDLNLNPICGVVRAKSPLPVSMQLQITRKCLPLQIINQDQKCWMANTDT